MLIDWITISIPEDLISENDKLTMEYESDVIYRLGDRGQIVYKAYAWDSIRSDSHAISWRYTDRCLFIQGSPARLFGDGSAIFGSGSSFDLDLEGCVRKMVSYLSKELRLPSLLFVRDENIKVTRIDVTQNYFLGKLERVREALQQLGKCEGGRYKVSQKAGDSIYWNHKSRLKCGKAYAKGPHIQYQIKKGKVTELSIDDQLALDGCLRLELTLKLRHIKRTYESWVKVSASILRDEYKSYFERMLGGLIMKDESEVINRLKISCGSTRVANSVMGTWSMIKADGIEKAKNSITKSTFYRHLRFLRKIGLSDSQIARGKTDGVMVRKIECVEVNSWEDLRMVANG